MKNIPEELHNLPQWVNWQYEERDGKVTKIPIDPKTGRWARSNDPATWSSFEKAIKRSSQVGFVFSEDDPYVGIDLDHCRDAETGEIAAWARNIIAEFSSYTEISPSGTGVHIIIEGELPFEGCKKGDIEIYARGRYFCVTGEELP